MAWEIQRDDVFSDVEAATLWVTDKIVATSLVDINTEPHKSIFHMLRQLQAAGDSGRLQALSKEAVLTISNGQQVQSFSYKFTAGALLDFAKSRGAVPNFLKPLQLEKSESVRPEKPLATTERNSLLKLVIGMAIRGYKFDSAATRNDSTGEIVEDLAIAGVPLDSDTVLKYLREGAALLPIKSSNKS